MAILRAATPGSGSYATETDWFEPDWQRSFWGENYARLLGIKRRLDPTGVFVCHHCVGSELSESARP
jgi:FAD/FMN-containing dehydrogenase